MRQRVGQTVALLVVLTCCGAAVGNTASAQEYSRGVLEASPVLPRDSVGVLYAGIRQWMSQQTSGVSPEMLAPVREDLYRVIQSVVLYTTAELEVPHLSGSDNGAEMFNLATYLGVYGAGLVAADLVQDSTMQLAPALLPEPPFELSYERPLFHLVSEAYSVSFPYYFMPWAIQRSPPEGGSLDVVIISTLHGRHVSAARTSQGTIMLVGSPTGSAADLAAQWRANLGALDVGACADPDWPAGPVVSHVCGVTAEGVQVEMGALAAPEEGAVVFVYSGLEGTYEANRPHFLTFLETFSWR